VPADDLVYRSLERLGVERSFEPIDVRLVVDRGIGKASREKPQSALGERCGDRSVALFSGRIG